MKVWLKGGIIGAILLILIGVLLFILIENCFNIQGKLCANTYDSSEGNVSQRDICFSESYNKCKIYTTSFYYLYNFPFVALSNQNYMLTSYSISSSKIVTILMFADIILIGFVFGVIVSWIIRKIKSCV